MALKLQDKQSIVTEVSEIARQTVSMVAVDYRGLTVAEMTAFRKAARKEGVEVKVIRNTLAHRAFEGTQFACMQSSLRGPILLVFAKEELGAAARLVRDFAKKNEKIVVKALSVDGQLLGKEQLESVASLPTREGALTQLLTVLQAPMAKFVRTLAATPTAFVRTLAAIRDQKSAGKSE